MSNWQLQEAKARLSEVVKKAAQEEASARYAPWRASRRRSLGS